jgi:class 3 adenylate cyclase/tetratricopeptide (TPR) repeat protein
LSVSVCRACNTTRDVSEPSGLCPTCGVFVVPDEADNRERRQVTVLFADIVDYTGLALYLDPEDLRTLLERYYALARTAIEAQGGVLAECLADGVVGHFGVPTAYQDTVDNALDAAEVLVSGISTLRARERILSVRVGLATGLVVAEYDGGVSRVTGASTVIAARLQAIAEANTIYVSGLTRRLSRRRKGFQFLGNRTLKGFAEPEQVWLFDSDNGRSEIDSSFPFVGRESELGELTALWKVVVETGRASPFRTLSGPPGIGKSRLLRELCDRCENGRGAVVLQAVELHRNTSLYPIAEWLRRSSPDFLLGPTDRYIRAVLYADAAPELLASEAPAAIRQGTFDALLKHFRHVLQEGPLRFIVEDLQWLDQSSIELIILLINEFQDYPIQWLATCRPEMNDQLAEIGGTIITVAELSRTDCLAAAASFCGRSSETNLENVVVKCEGIPMLLEHLSRALKDGLLLTEEAVAEMLLGVLTAWIDRTGPARRTAQYASVIGRNITPYLLAQIANRSENEVEGDIDLLCKAEILWRCSDKTVSFKHDLLREAAYSTLLHTKREALHRRCASALDRNNPNPNTRAVAEIAFHCEAAGDYVLAAEYRHRLGKYATAMGAFIEAENELRRAAELLSKEPQKSDEVRRHHANVLVSLAANRMQTRGFTDGCVVETYMESLALLKGLESTDLDSLAIYWGIFTYQVLIGQIKEAKETVERMTLLLRGVPDEVRRAEHTLSVLGTQNAIQFYSGQFLQQLETMKQIRGLYRFDRDAILATKYGMDLFATAQAFGPHSAAITGQFALTRTLIAEADAHQTLLEIPLMLPFVDIWCGVALNYIADFVEARQRIERGIECADHQGAAFWSATGRMWLAVVEFDQYGSPDCRVRLEEALALQKLIGVGVGVPYWSAKLAEAYARDGHDDRALELAEASLGDQESEGAWLAERQRICGFVHERGGRLPEALAYYSLAARTAQSQHAVLWEIRARTAAHGLAADRVNVDRLKAILSRMKQDSRISESHAAANLGLIQ